MLKLQNSPKLPDIHARLYCNANEKSHLGKGVLKTSSKAKLQ